MGYSKRKDPRTEEKPLFATFQDRVMASVIDTAVIYLLLQNVFNYITMRVFRYADAEAIRQARASMPDGAGFVAQLTYFLESSWESGLAQLWLVNSFLQSLIIGVILILMWREFHSTLGKYLIGLEFAGRGGEGTPTTKQYLLRFAGFYLSMPIFMIGFATLGLDKKKRAWHDMIAGTTVVYSKRGSIFRQGWDWIKAQFKK